MVVVNMGAKHRLIADATATGLLYQHPIPLAWDEPIQRIPKLRGSLVQPLAVGVGVLCLVLGVVVSFSLRYFLFSEAMRFRIFFSPLQIIGLVRRPFRSQPFFARQVA
ncbi:MAG TPA: hypothetical protein VNV25_25370 [Gemmatimonadaceae bacterium]|nr:hypothetical protein [Gemmatimonadaceae bacterium]